MKEKVMVTLELYSFGLSELRLKSTELRLTSIILCTKNLEPYDNTIELKDENGILVKDLLEGIEALVQDDRHDHLYLETVEKIDDTTLKLEFGS